MCKNHVFPASVEQNERSQSLVWVSTPQRDNLFCFLLSGTIIVGLNPNLGFVDPAPPGEDKVTTQYRNPSIHLQLQQTGDETSGSPGRHRTERCGNPSFTGSLLKFNLGFVRLTRPGEDKVPSPHHESFHIYTIQQTGDENGGLPGRYRPTRCGNPNPTGCLINPNLGFEQPAPPGEDKLSSPDQKSFHTSTTPANRGRKRWSPGSIPPSTVWKPQPGVRKAIAIRGG